MFMNYFFSGGWADKLQKSLIRHRANQSFKKLDPSSKSSFQVVYTHLVSFFDHEKKTYSNSLVIRELPTDWECIVIHVTAIEEGLLKCICLLREEDNLTPSRWFILLSSVDGGFKGTPLPSTPFKVIISDPW